MEDCSGSERGRVSMSIKTIAVYLVIASYLMNGNDTSVDLHFLHLLVFSALQDELIVKRNNHFFQSCTKQAPHFETNVLSFLQPW